MTTPATEDQWYAALSDVDCVRIMRLLEEHPTLLKVGWQRDLSRFSHGSRYHGPGDCPEPWEGCTALHAAAERGCVDLIVQVLLLFDFLDLVAVSTYHSKHGRGAPSTSDDEDEDEDEDDDDDTAHLKQGLAKKKEIAPDDVDGKSNDSFSREDLRDLLVAQRRSKKYMIPLAMVAQYCNVDAIILLIYAHQKAGPDPFNFYTGTKLSPKLLDQEDSENRTRLRCVTKEFLESLDDESKRFYLHAYSISREYNFLPHKEYFFHFCLNLDIKYNLQSKCLHIQCMHIHFWKKIRSLEDSLWRFLLELHDGRGSTPFLAAMTSGRSRDFVEMLKSWGGNDTEVEICAMTAPDAAGRTPAYIAAARGYAETIRILLDYADGSKDVSATVLATWRHPFGSFPYWKRTESGMKIDPYQSHQQWEHWTQQNPRWRQLSYYKFVPGFLSDLSKTLKFQFRQNGHNGLHAALACGHYEVARLVIEKACEHGWTGLPYNEHYDGVWQKDGQIHFIGLPNTTTVIEWDILAFACHARHLSPSSDKDDFVKFIFQKKQKKQLEMLQQSSKKGDFYKMDIGGLTQGVLKMPWTYLHILAHNGDYKSLKMFLDNPTCDPFIEDFEGNTVLHHAMHVREFGKFKFHLLDGFQDYYRKPMSRVDAQLIAERKGCINLLLQSGCDAFKENGKKQVPYPQQSLEVNAEFL